MAKRNAPDDIIDLTFDDSDDDTKKSIRNSSTNETKRKNQQQKKKAKRELPISGDGVEIIESPSKVIAPAAIKDDEIEIVDAPAPEVAVALLRTNNTNGDGDIQMVGTVNETRLPHMRPHCTKCKFQMNSSNRADIRANNEKKCDLCYCYVCDCPVKDCKSWNPGGIWFKNHCNATDQIDEWINQRRQASNQRRSPQSNNDATANTNTTLLRLLASTQSLQERTFEGLRSLQERTEERSSVYGGGPFEPGNIQAASLSSCTTCRKCGWHSKTFKIRGNDLRCLKCGRYAVVSNNVNKGGLYQRKSDDFFLGVKEVNFKIVAKDPRSMRKYRSNWKKATDSSDPAWAFDEASLEEDMFLHQIGKSPLLKSILCFASEWEEDKVREEEEEAIILEKQCDITLFQILEKEGFSLRHTNPAVGDYRIACVDIQATWNKERRGGTFKIKLYLPKSCTSFRSDSLVTNSEYSYLLGAWFNIFPFKLTDLSGHLKANKLKFPIYRGGGSTADRSMPVGTITKKTFKDIEKKYRRDSELICSRLALTSGSGDLTVGGTTNNNTSLKGVLQRYYKESFTTESFCRPPPTHDHWEKISHHRDNNFEPEPSHHDFILNSQDRVFAALCLEGPARRVKESLSNAAGIIEHLENLGHNSELFCEGLKVELLAYQKQSLKWALERETVRGGIQRYFWTKVEYKRVTTNNKALRRNHLYFNPIFGRFKKSRPTRIHGGIIAEEMGLGKTVISLALILKNPAPMLPISGSNINSLNTLYASEISGPRWDQDRYGETSVTHPKRGSILSRGTLVICPVSLVGQWIEEAKSKLEDPGLVYPYHGGNRKRDANILANNAIVVTTYQVLSSDDSYHRKKSSDPGYCPPLEQVRWWRIICDEGHTLRQPNTQMYRSTSKLVADHKWIVTGTPVNTSIKDLKSQLKFIGIEMVDEMFKIFCMQSRGKECIEEKGKLMFFLRSIMIRHTQRQTYRGTGTTLMSLPAKSERSIAIVLSEAERKEYDRLDAEAKKFYVDFKTSHSRDFSKHYLKLSQRLTPMRVACSGGCIPLDGDTEYDEEDPNDSDEEKKPAARKKQEKYSDFCFTAKFNVLLRELKRARDEDPTSKSLVFSQYTSTMNWLQQELPKHGFEFRTFSGSLSMKQRAKALHDFQLDPPTTVFLLSMRVGNCGINLTQANRVFLMEPGFNPALELQAIGRVHRLGQKRKVEVIRLLIVDTVETRIHKFLNKKYEKKSSPETEASTLEKPDEKKEDNTVGPVGNLSSERPKSKILAEEFDILFGVETKEDSVGTSDVHMPDAAIAAGFV